MIIHTLLFSLIVTLSSAFKILVVFAYPGKSHSLLGEGYVRNLLNAGHEVTYITPIPIKNAPGRLRQIDVSDNLKLFEADIFNFENIMRNKQMLQDKPFILQVCNGIANHTLWNPNVRRLIMDPKEHFDVVIAEWLYTEMYCGFSAVFNCPFIWSSSMDPHGLVLSLIDENPNPAYTANHMSALDPPFTFLQRLEELWEVFYMQYLKWSISDIENQIFQEGYGPAIANRGRSLPSLYEVSRNGSLMLGNSHVSTGRPLRLPQNYIPIAGYHIEEEGKPLPEDIQKIMDISHHGVIYFSMGTMLKSKTMPEALKNEFLDMFGRLKQTVIWKLEEDLPNLPKNIHLLQWAPQASILAHPKCILFITHGGLLSTTEAVKNGVPIIGIPMFADQFINVDRAVRKGFAKKVDFDYDTPKQLKVAIEDVVGDSRYRTKAQELSFIYHHRPMSPGQELVHWVEHVVETRGAPHLRSPALHVPFYQKFYLDLAGILLLTLIALKAIVTALLRRVFQSKKETEKKKLR